MDDAQIHDRLTKIKALMAGATTDGERDAAEAAMRRIQLKMDRAHSDRRHTLMCYRRPRP